MRQAVADSGNCQSASAMGHEKGREKTAGELLPRDLAAGPWWRAPLVARGVSAACGGEEHRNSRIIVIVVSDKAGW